MRALHLPTSLETGNDLATWPEIYQISPGSPSSGVPIRGKDAALDIITITIPRNTARFVRLRATVSP